MWRLWCCCWSGYGGGGCPRVEIVGESMSPTFHPGDRVLARKVDPGLVRTGDIVVIEGPAADAEQFAARISRWQSPYQVVDRDVPVEVVAKASSQRMIKRGGNGRGAVAVRRTGGCCGCSGADRQARCSRRQPRRKRRLPPPRLHLLRSGRRASGANVAQPQLGSSLWRLPNSMSAATNSQRRFRGRVANGRLRLWH